MLRKLFQSFLLTSAVYLFIDICTGWTQWSLTLEIPVFTLVNIFLSIYLANLFTTDTARSELILYVSWECLIGLVPFILTLLGILTFSLLPIVVGIICILLLILLVRFRWTHVVHEYEKTFHF